MHTFDINLSKLITKAISTAITNDTTKGARGGRGRACEFGLPPVRKAVYGEWRRC